MKKILAAMIVGVLYTVILGTANAVVPNVIPVGGMLADTEGQPLDGSYDVTFALYDVESGGTALWSEARTGGDAVAVESGMFTVYLGEVSGDLDFGALMNASGLWLGMTIGTDSEMNRIYLGTVPYAMEAQQCQVLADPAGQGIATRSWVTAQGYSTSDDLSVYATQAWVTGKMSGYMPTLDGTTCQFGIASIDDFGTITCAVDSVATHEASYGHLSPAEAAELTGEGDSSLHTHLALMIPSGAVMAFDLNACPDGWTELADARGRVIVGLSAGGTLGSTVGTELSDGENRAVGQHSHINSPGDVNTSTDGIHSHGVIDPGHMHDGVFIKTLALDPGDNYSTNMSYYSQHDTDVVDSAYTGISIDTDGGHNHTVAIDPYQSGDSGLVAGTNAPYIQLLYCRKD